MIKVKFIGFDAKVNTWQIFTFKTITLKSYNKKETKEFIQVKLNEWLKDNECKRGCYELL